MDAWTLAFSPDSQYLATGTHVGKVNIFGVESGKKEYSLDTRGKFILSIAYVRNTPCRVFTDGALLRPWVPARLLSIAGLCWQLVRTETSRMAVCRRDRLTELSQITHLSSTES